MRSPASRGKTGMNAVTSDIIYVFRSQLHNYTANTAAVINMDPCKTPARLHSKQFRGRAAAFNRWH